MSRSLPVVGLVRASANVQWMKTAMLEDRLVAQQRESANSKDNASTSSALQHLTDAREEEPATIAQLPSPKSSVPVSSEAGDGATSPSPGDRLAMSPTLDVHITDLMQLELDQLYFDRVHESMPVLHQRKYLSWSKSPDKKPSQRCLQYAMWTNASLTSTQFRHLEEPLYRFTRRMLESLMSGTDFQSALDLEQVQAWELVVSYELLKMDFEHSWMTAGRIFRLVQIMRLHEVDTVPIDPNKPSDMVEAEEKRRLFWMAYSLDHNLSMRGDWPITLTEHMVCTRLPGPELEFQNSQPIAGPLLSEAIATNNPTVARFMNEKVVLATITGRVLAVVQQHKICRSYGDTTRDWEDQFQWLENIIDSRLRILSEYYPQPANACDPNILFTNIMSRVTIIYLCQGMKSAARPFDPRRAQEAAAKIIELSQVICERRFFQMCPLMPTLLIVTAKFLFNNRDDDYFQQQLDQLLDVFGQMKDINNPDRSLLDVLKRSHVPSDQVLFRFHSETRAHRDRDG
ncbi:fungal-specific transcription factor domain-containing protein [Xylariaceae sp. FL0016]|nr:fungal-specific transcription factor domain-containing protein [Xylariaceae sp. FL0016]